MTESIMKFYRYWQLLWWTCLFNSTSLFNFPGTNSIKVLRSTFNLVTTMFINHVLFWHHVLMNCENNSYNYNIMKTITASRHITDVSSHDDMSSTCYCNTYMKFYKIKQTFTEVRPDNPYQNHPLHGFRQNYIV
jgi:hypothetical protein